MAPGAIWRIPGSPSHRLHRPGPKPREVHAPLFSLRREASGGLSPRGDTRPFAATTAPPPYAEPLPATRQATHQNAASCRGAIPERHAAPGVPARRLGDSHDLSHALAVV